MADIAFEIERYEKKMKNAETMTDLLLAMSAWQTYAKSRGLTDEQKAYVDDETLAALTAAEEAIAALTADKAAADAVTELINALPTENITVSDAEQINGDRSIIRCADGVWTAFGFPFAGSSGIFRNEAVPIRAIVVLRQAPENTIERLLPSEAFRLLYSECAIQRWDDAGHTRTVDHLLQMCSMIPAYMLRCTPDERAVRLLQQTLSMEEST